MIKGVTIQIERPYANGTDRFNNVVYGMTGESVSNVLVEGGSSDDLEASRPEGMTVDYTLRFPKGFNQSLQGAQVTLPEPFGGTYRVIGDVTYLIPENTPTPWNGYVQIGHAHG